MPPLPEHVSSPTVLAGFVLLDLYLVYVLKIVVYAFVFSNLDIIFSVLLRIL
jgi:hypothetical protein